MVQGPTFLSLPAWRQVSETWRPPGRNLGEHRLVRRSGTTSRGTVALVFCWRVRSYPRTEVLSIFVEKISTQGRLNVIYWGEFLQQVDKNFSLLLRSCLRCRKQVGNTYNHALVTQSLVQSKKQYERKNNPEMKIIWSHPQQQLGNWKRQRRNSALQIKSL